MKLEHLLGRIGVGGLSVKVGVPYTRGAVLGVSGAGGIYKELLAGGVRADQGHQLVGADGLVGKERNQLVRRVGRRWQEAVWRWVGVVFAPDEAADSGPEGADNRGDIC